MKVLIANPFGIGDVLFTTPLIDNIKRSFPDTKIAYLCNIRVTPLLEKDQRIYKIFIYEKDQLRTLWKQSRYLCLKEIKALLSDIKKEEFDYVIDFSFAEEFGFFFWLAGIKKRIGYNYKNRAKFLNYKIKLEGFKDKHVIEYYLDLLKFFNIEIKEKATSIFISEDEKKQAKDFLKQNGISADNRMVAVIPGGGASWGVDSHRKHYAADKFAQVCDRLIKEQRVGIIILGDLKEKKIVDEVVKNMGEKPSLATNSLLLREFTAILSCCSLILCNDGGPLHVAVALNVPTVSIFGPVDEKVYGPYPPSKRHTVITADIDCRPCYKNFKVPDCQNRRCFDDLTSDEVYHICERQLNAE